MGRIRQYGVVIEDVNGSFERFLREAPKVARKYLHTAVFLTAARMQTDMETHAPIGPEGAGLTPGQHIKLDIEHRGRTNGLTAQVGVFDPEQARVALFNEYVPNRQPFMRIAAQKQQTSFGQLAADALAKCERDLAI